MNSWVAGVVFVLCGAAAVLYVIDIARDRNTQDAHFIAAGLVLLTTLGQLVGGAVALARTDREVNGIMFVSYALTCVLAPVVGAIFSLSERSRVGTSILLLSVATVAGLELRLLDIWGGAGV